MLEKFKGRYGACAGRSAIRVSENAFLLPLFVAARQGAAPH